MAEADPLDPTTLFDLPSPFFVRKVDRPSHWNTPQEILEKVFPVDEDGTISVYRIEALADVARIAIALSANRVARNPRSASLTEPLVLVGIKPEEFGSIQLQQEPGLTDCRHANKRHFNAIIQADDDRERMVNSLLSAGRTTSRLTKGLMKEALSLATEDGCHAVPDNPLGDCTCENE